MAADRAAALLGVVARGLRLVVIRLGADNDAQAIFETLNVRGAPLTAMDLVKNFLFQKLDPHAPATHLLDAGLLAVGDELAGVGRDGRAVQGVVDAAGRLVLNDVAYAYPTKPAKRVRGTNGWTFWCLRSVDGPTLDDLRACLLASH